MSSLTLEVPWECRWAGTGACDCMCAASHVKGWTWPVQGEVLEELRHHYPLELLMALSDAAVGAMQASGSTRRIRKALPMSRQARCSELCWRMYRAWQCLCVCIKLLVL